MAELKTISDKVEKSSSATSNSNICKICFSGASEASLISPCRCKGTMKYSHASCLNTWLNYSGTKKCEICRGKFNLKKLGYKPLKQWRMVSISCDEVLHLLLLLCCFFIIVATVCWWKVVFSGNSKYSVFLKSDSMRTLVYASYGPLNILCFALALLEIKLVCLPILTKWKRINQEILILPYKVEPGTTDLAKRDRPCPQEVETLGSGPAITSPNLCVPHWLKYGKKCGSYNLAKHVPESDAGKFSQTGSFHRPLLASSQSVGSLEELLSTQTRRDLAGRPSHLSENSFASHLQPRLFSKVETNQLNNQISQDERKLSEQNQVWPLKSHNNLIIKEEVRISQENMQDLHNRDNVENR